jgi:flagellar basal-body rod protein FlgF
MDRGLFIAASGMMDNQRLVDIVSTNLSNEATPGYKADRGVQGDFSEFLMRNLATGQDIGKMSMGSYLSGVATDFGQGSLSLTGRTLDVAFNGNGFFAVQTGQGVRYTRDGSFERDAAGFLTTQTGNRVLDAQNRPIQIPSTDITITATGQISAGTQNIGQLGMVSLNAPAHQGQGLYSGTPSGAAPGSVQQGALEGSNVDATDAMTTMMSAMRTFETSQRVLKAIDATLQKAANEIGRV